MLFCGSIGSFNRGANSIIASTSMLFEKVQNMRFHGNMVLGCCNIANNYSIMHLFPFNFQKNDHLFSFSAVLVMTSLVHALNNYLIGLIHAGSSELAWLSRRFVLIITYFLAVPLRRSFIFVQFFIVSCYYE